MNGLLSKLACLSLSALPLSAWQNEVTTKKPGPHLKIPPVHLSFKVSWDGKINSANVDFLFGKPDKRYPPYIIAQLWGESTGIAKGLFPYQYNFTSFMRKEDYRPAIFAATESDRDEKRTTTNHSGRKVKSTEITDPFRKGKATITKKKTFTFTKAPVYDLLSAFLYVRSLDLKVGEEIALLMHAFTTPHIARIRVRQREVHRGFKHLRINLRLQELGPKMNLLTFDKIEDRRHVAQR
jgi:hypothetical protein